MLAIVKDGGGERTLVKYSQELEETHNLDAPREGEAAGRAWASAQPWARWRDGRAFLRRSALDTI